LAQLEEVKKLTSHVTIDLGIRIDILVNNAGIQQRHRPEEFPDSSWDQVIQVNLTACWILARDVGKHMLEVRNKQDLNFRGKIINIGSLASFQGGTMMPAYATAKHGLVGLTKALSNDWSSKAINVNAIAPGYIITDMTSDLIENTATYRQISERIPMGRWGTGDDFKGPAVFLASDASNYVSGECLKVDGGWMAR
jgi:2-deoxy-D-gluconate 3-dehydrogenase